MKTVGTVRRVARFPVKSMRGEVLEAANLTLHGIENDRRYAFVQAASKRDFPWLTAREMPEMLTYQADVVDAEGGESVVKVTLPTGEQWPVDSDELRRVLESRSGRAIYLLRNHCGSFDAAPISFISQQTVARIAEESGTEENSWRFRPNLLLDLESGNPFEELQWVGKVLRVGDTARIAIIKKDERCVMITTDPVTLQSSPSVLKTVVQQHERCAGVYGAVLTRGELHAGDTVYLEN